MPAIEITSQDQLARAFDVLFRVGGTFQGVGNERHFLVVSDAQYRALVKARVVKENGSRARNRGKKIAKNSKV